MIFRTDQYSLRDALDSYLQTHALKPRSRDTLQSSVNSLLSHLHSEDVPVAGLTIETLNAWLLSLTVAPRTIIKHRGNLLTLLRDAADEGHCPEPIARRVRKPPRPKPKPRAWSLPELRRVVRACDDAPGYLRRYGVRFAACIYFGCIVRCAYETGLRRGNLLSLRSDEVGSDGTVYVKHEKTGEPHICTLGATTLALWRQLPGDMPLQWKDAGSFYDRWTKIVTAAEVPHGSLQRIRKTAATQVWLEHQDNPTRVQQFLGHLTADMWRHYVDRSQGSLRPPRPPEL